MKELKEKELKQVSGGISKWAVGGIIALILFGIGVFDGYARPCKYK